MIEIIKGWIINIVTIILILSFLEILLPDSKMKKYINLILGFIVMLVILGPIINVLNNNGELQQDVFSISGQLSKNEYAFINSNIENRQEEQLASLYKERIKQDIVYRVESRYDVKVTEVYIELEDSKKEEMGEIKKLELSVGNKNYQLDEDTIPIVKIDVSNEDINEIDSNDVDDMSVSLKKKIKEDISNIYNINENNVEIMN